MPKLRKKDSKPRKGDTVRIKWNGTIPLALRGKRGTVELNLPSKPCPYYVDSDEIEEGDSYWGPFAASDLDRV